MGFFTGRLSYLRFKVTGAEPGMFGPDHLERLERNRIGIQRVAAADGIEAGWSGGEHILDTKFDLAKNVVNDTLQFALRIDANKIPSDLMRAYSAIELQALAAANPTGRPTNRQRREARDTARQRVEDEAKDGRFLRRKAYPVLWDAQSNELLVGTTSLSIIDRLHQLFEQTFGQKFEMLTSGVVSYRLAEVRNQTRGVEDATPSAFLPGISASSVSWIMDDISKDFLGNEFLLWLWWYLENEDDTLKLSDGSEVTVMMSSTLALECPRGQTGRESITHEGPTRLPEAATRHPERQAPAQGRPDRRPPRRAIRPDPDGGEPRRQRREDARPRGERGAGAAGGTRHADPPFDRDDRSDGRCLRRQEGQRQLGQGVVADAEVVAARGDVAGADDGVTPRLS